MATYIIFDLEFMVVRKQHHLADIIEIGAVKMVAPGERATEGGDDDGRVADGGVAGVCREAEGTPLAPVLVDKFHTYVRPSRNHKLTPDTTTFTGVTQEQVERAPAFPEALKSFVEWIGEEPYYLIAWGPDDKFQFMQQCHYHELALDWLLNYNDLQLAFSRLNGMDHGRRFGLKKALEMLEFPFDGQPHRALDDAFNTGKIFTVVYPKMNLATNNAAEEQLTSSELVYSSGDDEKNLPFGDLAKRLGMAH
ncbi:exonuclease domain-containing protein [Paenibacillus sp. DYY-L-2]|uniref:exonuclease domain-containing protein n=1 Tax=Paenibacillus sp. DYY-L-2 TaxID=3447013 RepID=UPI003F505594